ncbi:MAG: hypothetical protein RLZZ95_40, partial [Pseudomonadota bacterium]
MGGGVPFEKKEMAMNRVLFLLLSVTLSFGAVAQHNNKETQEDIARHRAMAEAHAAAAKCLES